MSDPLLSIAQHYHERTKYHPNMLSGPPLDWENQPVPFKTYKLGASHDLKPYLTQDAEESDAIYQWQRLSRLLFCSYGLTVKMMTQTGDPVYLRAAPSAGGLYPAEVYLLSRGTPLLSEGIYSYQPQTHSLLQVWESEIWTKLQRACFWHPALAGTQLAIATSAIFQRSAWRYQARAYRRIGLDTGHLLGNIELACAVNDFRPHLMGGFCDQAMSDLLYLDAEQEGVMAVMAVADITEVNQNLSISPTALPSDITTDFPKIADGHLLHYLHQVTQISEKTGSTSLQELLTSESILQPEADKYNFPFCLKVPTAIAPIDWGFNLEGLGSAILKRRSTRAYSGSNLTLDELKQLLDFTYHPEHYTDQGLDPAPDYFDLSLVETFIAVSGVDRLEEGCYYYAPKAEELRQVRFKNMRRELHAICLGQNLGRDAAVVLFHAADLQQAVGRYGDRAYRYLHMDSGHLSQRLNLAAVYLGLGVSGIGGYFDDQVNEVLGISADEAVLYMTTLGRSR